MKTAAIYLNEGNESQFGVSLEEQLDILTKIAKEKGYRIEKVYIDIEEHFITGYYPKLNELNSKIYNTDYDLVLFYKSFNMFHEIYDYLKQIEFCINSHVDVYSHMEFIDSTAGSEGFKFIHGLIATDDCL